MLHPTPRPRRVLLAVLLLCALVAGACSGGDDDGAAGDPTPDADDGGGDGGGGGDSGSGDGPAPTPEPPPVEVSECPVDALDDADGPVEITLWHAMSASVGRALESLIDEFNASQDRIVVDAVFQGGYEENFTKYIGTLRGDGDLPDVIQLNETSMQQMVDSRSIVPVAACIEAAGADLSDYPARLLDQYRVGGVLVTMPFQMSNPVLYYDGNIFTASGLDPDAPPATFDELLEVSRSLVESGTVEQALALDVDAWMFEQWVNMGGGAVVKHDNGRASRATEALLDEPVALGVLEWLATMNGEGLIRNTGRGTDQSALAKYIAVGFGNAAMTIGSSANLGEIYNQLGNFPDVDIRVAPFPGPTAAGSGEGGGDALGGIAVGGGSLYLVADADPAERAAVWELMAWLNEPAQQAAWSVATGYVPTRLSAVDDPALVERWDERPGYRVAWDQIADAGPIVGGGGPVIGDHLGVREAIELGLERIYAGDDPADVAAAMDTAATEAIADYNRRIGE